MLRLDEVPMARACTAQQIAAATVHSPQSTAGQQVPQGVQGVRVNKRSIKTPSAKRYEWKRIGLRQGRDHTAAMAPRPPPLEVSVWSSLLLAGACSGQQRS